MNESNTRSKLIDPKLDGAGWKPEYVFREHYFTDGRKLTGNKRGKRCFADYILRLNNINLAIIEAKAETKEPTAGLQQVIQYGKMLNVRFLYSTNGHKIYEYDLNNSIGNFINSFPTPDELYNKTFNKNNTLDGLLSQPFHFQGNMRPRYYQENAVNEVMKAISDNQKRILLTLATGTGKTYIAFQIAYKLLNAKWNLDKLDRRPRILFLADRNILADQAMNTFNPIEKDIIKIDGDEIRRRNGIVPTNAFVFFAIYQAISEKENIGGYYKKYPSDFFDLIIIDECHRGSAHEEGSWRAILDYFSDAVHLGLTATPKRNDNVDTYNYFGKPVYTYSLKNGINDGFLSPFKVKRIKTNIDEYIFTSEDTILSGEVSEKMYKINDFNKKVILPDRINLIAKTIIEQINEFDKTIVFCVDQPHALNIRDAINKHKKINDPDYCVRVTSDEKEIGRKYLENFQDNDKDIPVVLTSSQMLTTGVDARNVRNIILVRSIGSIVEFKQIVGRGTRLFEGKDFFTIVDFTGASEFFYDDQWDGLPIDIDVTTVKNNEPSLDEIKEPKDDYDVKNEEKNTSENQDFNNDLDFEKETKAQRKGKLVIKLSNNRELKVIDIETRFIDENGTPLSSKEFIEKLILTLPHYYQDSKQLIELWSNPESRENFLKELSQNGFDKDQLETLSEMFQAKDSDLFDVLNHISFEKEILKRKERVRFTKLKNDFFSQYKSQKEKDFLHFILNRYEIDGIEELKRDNLGNLIKLNNLGTVKDASKIFGSSQNLIQAYYGVQKELYVQ
ncbi:MAG: DEAD/DEAH box helicase family protein [Candidatus Cloacimonetes bacterium]|nr:DEAD/DEAH box helicase family protein [Candidatus Cloacimonadota bacterium]